MCAAKNELPFDEEGEDIELYDIDYSRPRLVFIFNNVNFSQLKARIGAIKDQERVVKLFKEL